MFRQSSVGHLELRFRPRGAGRFFSAGFLGFWLCGWAAGELFVAAVLIGGFLALATGHPPPGSTKPLEPASAAGGGAFLLVWISFWTWGGMVAIRELLRMLWAEDHLVLSPGNILLTRRLGPFRQTRQIAPRDIQRLYLQRPTSALMAQIGPEIVELTNLGTIAERTSAADQLRNALNLPVAAEYAGTAVLPEGWEELFTARGETVLTRSRKTRRLQARFLTAIALVVWAGLFLLIRESLHSPTLWGLTAMAAALASWLAWGAYRLHHTHQEWRIERGRLTLQRCAGWQVTELARACGLELIETSDSDGDRAYVLRALTAADPALRHGQPARPLTIHRVMNDPTEPRNLGHWLAQRAAIPLHDQIPTDATRQADFQQLRDRLARSGTLGRIAAGFLESVQRRHQNHS